MAVTKKQTNYTNIVILTVLYSIHFSYLEVMNLFLFGSLNDIRFGIGTLTWTCAEIEKTSQIL